MVFALSVSKWTQAQKEGMDKAGRRVTFAIFSRLIVRSTAVDTGRFRANWQVGFDKVVRTEIRTSGTSENPTPPPPPPDLPEFIIGHVVYFSNNVPYANRLEYDGWSNKMPQGVVRIVRDQFKNITDEHWRGGS